MLIFKSPAQSAAVLRISAVLTAAIMLNSLAAQDRQPVDTAPLARTQKVQHANATSVEAPESLIFSSGPIRPVRPAATSPASGSSFRAVTPVSHQTSGTDTQWTARTSIQIPSESPPGSPRRVIQQTAIDPVPVPPAATKPTTPQQSQPKSQPANQLQAREQPQPPRQLQPPSRVYHQSPPVYHSAPDHIYEPYHQPHHRQRRPDNWIQMDALVWWTSAVDVPPLSTVSPAGTPPTLAGIVGPNSRTLYGNEIHGDEQGGFRIRAGHGFDRADGRGWTVEFLTLLSRGTDFQVRSNGDPILARPFNNVGPGTGFGGTPDAELTAFPGVSQGMLSIHSETRMFGVGLHYWGELYDASADCDGCSDYHSACGSRGCGNRGCGHQCDSCIHDSCSEYYGTTRSPTIFAVKVGPRFYHLDDDLYFDERFSTATGNQFALYDSFDTENNFLGAELGLQSRVQKGRLSFNMGVQLALGATRQELDIRGRHSAIMNGNFVQGNTGFFAKNSNSGSTDRTRFSVVPALDLQLGWKLRSGWQANVGYQWMYWTNVLRAGEQIDPNLDPAVFGQPVHNHNQPARLYHESDYVAHGLSFGLERRF